MLESALLQRNGEHPFSCRPAKVRIIFDKTDAERNRRTGLALTITGTAFFSIMAGLVYAADSRASSTSPLLSSFFRITVNLIVLTVPFVLCGRGPVLLGDRSWPLYLRGLCGSVSLIAFFCSIQAIGIGESSFLRSSSGVFIALLGPLVLGERSTARGWLAILASLRGLYLMLRPDAADTAPLGRLLGLGSGLFGALAWLLVARSGRTNKPVTVIFYFCFIGTLVHVFILPFIELKLRSDPAYYALLAASGLFATAGQLLCTRGYQLAPAHLNASVEYLGPVMNTAIGALVFSRVPQPSAMAGAMIVFFCGVLLPFWRGRQIDADAEVTD